MKKPAADTNQPSLFDARPQAVILPPIKLVPKTGAQLRDAGMERVIVNAGEPWNDVHDRELRAFLAGRREPFQTEDFREWFASRKNPPAHTPHVWGALWNAAAKRGWIAKTGRRVKMKSAKAHARDTAEWRSCL
jgi:hypothetical protein